MLRWLRRWPQVFGKVRNSYGYQAGVVIGISTTGVAGPEPVGKHPVGEIFIGVSLFGGESVYQFQLEGNRSEIREQACDKSIHALREQLGL